jgi:hypothetical protein
MRDLGMLRVSKREVPRHVRVEMFYDIGYFISPRSSASRTIVIMVMRSIPGVKTRRHHIGKTSADSRLLANPHAVIAAYRMSSMYIPKVRKK